MTIFLTFFRYLVAPCVFRNVNYAVSVSVHFQRYLFAGFYLPGLGVYVMMCSVYKLSGSGNGMKVFPTCMVLLPAIIELGLFATLNRIFGR